MQFYINGIRFSHCKEQYLAFAVNSLNFNPDLKYLNVFRQLITICKGGNVEPSIHTEVSDTIEMRQCFAVGLI